MGKFLKFERMITPIFIQIVFWIGFIAIIIAGFATAIMGIFSDTGKIVMILSGIATVFIGPIILRVYCEILIVIFKMQGSLIDIREALNNSNRPTSPTPTPTPTPPPSPAPSQTSSQSSQPSDADVLL